MVSVQERLQIIRGPLDKWSVREQLCLASAVARSGDQNWMSVSRALKPFGEPNRPSDWFHQKNCAAQYGALLENVETPKRKKRTFGSTTETVMETPVETILRKLTNERRAELKKLLAEEKAEYQRLQEEMALLQSGNVSEEQLDKWCKEIEEEEQRKEQEAIAHTQWLKERELKKQEIERAWRPVLKSSSPNIGQKRKISDSGDNSLDVDQTDDVQQLNTVQEPAKPALSPLLTSLLKSPSQVVHVVGTSSILHNAITNQRPVSTNTTPSPTIASLLNSSTGVTVSPGLQQLVSTAIGQEPTNSNSSAETVDTTDLLEDAVDTLPNLKVEDIESTILSSDEPLPEIKNEEVEVIISDLIESASADDIVNDPEQHLQLDGNVDIIANLANELKELCEEEEAEEEKAQKEEAERREGEAVKTDNVDKLEPRKEPPKIDPFEFEEDPEIFPSKLNSSKQDVTKTPATQEITTTTPIITTAAAVAAATATVAVVATTASAAAITTVAPPLATTTMTAALTTTTTAVVTETVAVEEKKEKDDSPHEDIITEIKKEVIEEQVTDDDLKEKKEAPPEGSVEIVEIVVEEDELDKQLNKSQMSQIQDIVHSFIKAEKVDAEDSSSLTEELKDVSEALDFKIENEATSVFDEPSDTVDIDLKEEDIKKDTSVDIDIGETSRRNTFTPEYGEEFFDMSIEVTKLDKSGKAKRDYSRTKKKEEKDIDILLAVEKAVSAQLEENELTSDTMSDKEYSEDKKIEIGDKKIKNETDRSNSPWTEEEEISNVRSRRRYSTPATPIDSVPNSPASSIAYFDDDREYRNWKKSVLLLYSRLAAHKSASLFLKPITDDQAPGYHTVVYRPMDLQTIRKNIENGTIRTTSEFQRDVALMFANAIMYNKTHSVIYNMVKQMQEESVEQIKIWSRAQSQDLPTKRETRTSESGTKRKRGGEESARTNKKRKED